MDFTTDFSSSTNIHDRVGIHFRIAVTGPPLLLLHGYPQTGYMWHKIALLLLTNSALLFPTFAAMAIATNQKPTPITAHIQNAPWRQI